MCWSSISGASALPEDATSERAERLARFEAAIEALDDVDHDWWVLPDLLDASFFDSSRRFAEHLRLTYDVARRTGSPALATFCDLYSGHARMFHDGAVEAARSDYLVAAERARTINDERTLGLALRAIAIASCEINLPRAVDECLQALELLHEVRLTQKTVQVLEALALALAQTWRDEEALVVLGHLERHVPKPYGLETMLGFRDRVVALLASTDEPSHWREHGAALSTRALIDEMLTLSTPVPL